MSDGRRIVAIGGGGFSARPGNPELDRYVLEQSPHASPHICLLPTASGDPDEQIQRFYRAMGEYSCWPSHLSLFRLGEQRVDIRERLLGQDIVYVGGGSLSNLLAIWRVHRLDEILYEAWRRGIVLAGISAGSMCWFGAGVTKSHGEPRVARGLGFLPFSNSVHWSSEPERRRLFRAAVCDGEIAPGYGVDDGAALLFAGTQMLEAVRTSGSGGAVFVDRARESPISCAELDAPAVDRQLLSIEEFRLAKRLQHG